MNLRTWINVDWMLFVDNSFRIVKLWFRFGLMLPFTCFAFCLLVYCILVCLDVSAFMFFLQLIESVVCWKWGATWVELWLCDCFQTLAGVGLSHHIYHCSTWHAATSGCYMARAAQLPSWNGGFHGWTVDWSAPSEGQLSQTARSGGEYSSDCLWSFMLFTTLSKHQITGCWA